MSKTHIIKAWPEFWDALADGRKTFEIRYNDRGYAAGDILEIHRATHAGTIQLEPTPAEPPAPLLRRVVYVLPGALASNGVEILPGSVVVMSLVPAFAQDADGKADKMMIEHLRETLTSLRDQIAVELSGRSTPPSDKLIAQMINQIDEALDT